MSRNKQVSETHLLGLLLAVVGGFLDAYTYLCRGRVFANAQTGNIVLLGVNLTNRTGTELFITSCLFSPLSPEFWYVKLFKHILNGKRSSIGDSLLSLWKFSV